ncbi:DoxX family protein [Niabella beijingensis]|uniref:DoxX family protein n=1 Tax=Niabella beijingensis TaxID=2872700 RepID=UPI001CBE7CAB|nr:DoxX family protein [Niabella beijingensis]MBZ4189239.1 DoxX family protein [Niabella beijingensis]
MELFTQTTGLTSLILRLTLGLVMLPHGWQKMAHFNNTLMHLQQDYHLPWLVAVLVILTEFIAPVLLVAGLASRAMALLLILLMTGAVFAGHHWQHGFFMNWFGNQKGEGFEYHLLAIGLGIAIVLSGSGKWSVDQLLGSRW